MTPAVKICGLSRPEDIQAVNRAKADYAGFVFFEKSKRNISLERAAKLLKVLDPQIRSVAVCVSPEPSLVRELRQLKFDILQIHGAIHEEILKEDGLSIWQAVNLADGIHPEAFCFHPSITGYVVDGANYGGGKTFGWEDDAHRAKELAEAVRGALFGQTFILAGGLNAENAAQGIRVFSPDIVDVSSGVERDGVKDSDLIEQFIRKVREQQ